MGITAGYFLITIAGSLAAMTILFLVLKGLGRLGGPKRDEPFLPPPEKDDAPPEIGDGRMVAALLVGDDGTEIPVALPDMRGVRIGCDAARSDVVAPYGDISPMHCEIRREGERLYIIDLGSANGTFLNGEPLKGRGRVEFSFGDAIGLGGHETRFIKKP